MNKELLERLSNANGISGDESAVRNIIINEIKNSGAEYYTDNMGNLLVTKKGRKAPEKKLLVSAHMDEVGFIVSYITDDGYLKFDQVGGIDRRVILGKSVTVGKNVNGVVSAAPIPSSVRLFLHRTVCILILVRPQGKRHCSMFHLATAYSLTVTLCGAEI